MYNEEIIRIRKRVEKKLIKVYEKILNELRVKKEEIEDEISELKKEEYEEVLDKVGGEEQLEKIKTIHEYEKLLSEVGKERRKKIEELEEESFGMIHILAKLDMEKEKLK